MTDQPSTTATVEEGGPTPRFMTRNGSIDVVVDHDYERFANHLEDLLNTETGSLWLHVGECVERLSPAISPFDKREAVAEILGPVRQAFNNAFS